MELYRQTQYRGFNIDIYYDPDPESPREWDNLGTIYTAHRRYRPEKEFDDHFDIEEVFADRIGNFSAAFNRAYIALPIYMYDHSGVTISTSPFSCHWDSGFFGIVAVSLDKVRKEYGWKKITSSRRKKIEGYLLGEVQLLDNYYTGEVYGFRVVSVEDHTEEIDSCWGYYGSDGLEQIESECKDIINLTHKKRGIQLFLPFIEFPELAII